MENTTTLILITIGLQQDVENGDVSAIVVEMSQENATRILLEQEECPLAFEDGALATLINSYALLCGYQFGWFVRADVYKEDLEDGKEA